MGRNDLKQVQRMIQKGGKKGEAKACGFGSISRLKFSSLSSGKRSAKTEGLDNTVCVGRILKGLTKDAADQMSKSKSGREEKPPRSLRSGASNKRGSSKGKRGEGARTPI